jgi:hypothetical protein
VTMTNEELNLLRHHDWHHVTCQCEVHDCGCVSRAVLNVAFHDTDHCTEPDVPFGNRVQLLCLDCFRQMLHAVDAYLTQLNEYGRAACLTCGCPLVARTDILREIRPLL